MPDTDSKRGETSAARYKAARRLADLKQFEAAERMLRRSLAANPKDAKAAVLLAELAFNQGRSDIAVQWLEFALSIHPARLDWRLRAAEACCGLGLLDAATRHASFVIAHNPRSVAASLTLAKVFERRGESSRALAILHELYRQDPSSMEVGVALVELLKAQGQVEEAHRLLTTYVQGEAPELAALLLLAQAQWEDGDVEAAVRSYRRAVDLEPTSVETWLGLGQALEDAGDRKAAESAYCEALRLDPARGFTLGALLELNGAQADEDLVNRGRVALLGTEATDVAKALVGYGLGKVYAGRRDYATAFQYWQLANAARRREIGPFDRAAFTARIERLMALFTKNYFRDRADWGSPDLRPVFIVGMPRSGTTLVEQIISSHPDAIGYGELQDIPQIARRMARDLNDRWPDAILRADRQLVERFAARYLEGLRRRRQSDALRFVDKAPTNFLYLGLIATLFPNAHVVWCRRDARDVCLSIYSENFGLSQKHATDLGDLAVYFRQHERIMRYWQSVLPIAIHEVSYESLIDSPRAHIAALLDALGLEWNDRCMNFHSSERSVQTPSRWQVRQPLYASSVGKWKHYEPWLGPLLSALQHESP